MATDSKKQNAAGNEKKEYTKGEALANTVADLNAANFKNKRCSKWTEIK
jgi:hypothetical protein